MGKELIISQTLNEYRAVLIDNGEIVDFLLERIREHGDSSPRVGNIYKGRVVRVLPGMQSAFVDIGQEKAAFLYVDDAYIPTLEEQRAVADLLKQQQTEVQSKMGEIIPDELSTFTETMSIKFRPDASVENILKEGDEILVQVAKEPISSKGPRVTRHITLAGRHVVFMPFIEHTGVSRRIEDDKERDRLKDILDSIRPEGKGIIARTVAEGQSYKTLKSDFNMLVKIWRDVQKASEKLKAPSLCYKDLSFVQRVLRDITDEDVDLVTVDTKDNFKEVEKFALKYLPALKGKAKFYDAETPLFEHYGVELEIERALSNKVFLKSGGSLNIDQTEALVSVDVNTGKFVGRKNLEDTILKTNLEAVKEIAYQLRLRNCGGIIIIDFIDMERVEHRTMVYQALLEALKKDRAKTNVLPISSLGLVEMTRKRTRDTLTRIMCSACPYCEGAGRIKSTLTVCYEIVRELNKIIVREKVQKIFVYAHPEVSALLCGEDIDIIENLETKFDKAIVIRSENNYHIEQYEIFPQDYA
ncbi:MAG: ribonuclease G [Bdellovibrionales bacterium GWA2_49_15]|nr:MAG: ribonuclease G [Bdellovibrionales bacterium GWA2_49_15]HAZ12031.1 Rne/Rng family ribonuclease [Bdellovibrionales bacterium]